MVTLICIIISGVLKKMSQSVECSGEKYQKYICDKELSVQKKQKNKGTKILQGILKYSKQLC